MESAPEELEGVVIPLLGRALTPDEAAVAATTPIHSLPLSRTLLIAFAEMGCRTVADLIRAARSAGSFGPVRGRRIRQAILSAFGGEFSPAMLRDVHMTALPARIDELLARLDERRRTIIGRKYGLWDGRRYDHYQIAATVSLDYRSAHYEISAAHGELRGLLRVRSEDFQTALRSLYRQLLAAKQGMAGVHEWEDPSSVLYEGQAEACLGFAFLCRVGNVVPERLVAMGLDGVCYDSPLTNRRHDEAVDAMKTALVNAERPISFKQMRGWLRRIETSEEFLRRCVAVSRELGFMRSGMIGLRSSAYFGAHSLRETARAALSSLREPAHFERIAQEIERLYPERAPVNPQSVYHALVIHKNEFVLARHGGVYGLSEWPVRAMNSLKDFLSDFLRQKGGRA
ncbi:MAG: hypothetical protein ACHQ51_12900, partial [Elusimicrobiota bacterium]